MVMNYIALLRGINVGVNAICSKIPSTWVEYEEMRTDVMFLWEKYNNLGVIENINLQPRDSVKYVPGALLWNVKAKDYVIEDSY